MAKILIVIVFFLSLISLPVYAQNFEVREVGENSEYAVLADQDTGEEWVVETNDEIYGWKVVKITADYVTIRKPREGLPALRSDIPVNKEEGTNIVSQKQANP